MFHVAARGSTGAPQNFTWLCWGRHRFTSAELASARADLESIVWTRFHDNFLRFNVTPGEIDWFDDFTAITSNALLAAQLARRGTAGESCSTPSNIRENSSTTTSSAKPGIAPGFSMRLRLVIAAET